MARIKASDLPIVEQVLQSQAESTNGSQRENAVIELYLAHRGWGRYLPPVAYEAAFGIPLVDDGNGRGRGPTGADAGRRCPSRSTGADWLQIKAPRRRPPTDRKGRKQAPFTSGHDMFRGTRETLVALIQAWRRHARNGKAMPVLIAHTDGDTFAPVILEWACADFATMIANVGNPAGWDTLEGVPVRPHGFRAGRGANPTDVWAHWDGENWNLAFSCRKMTFRKGTSTEMLDHIDEVCAGR